MKLRPFSRCCLPGGILLPVTIALGIFFLSGDVNVDAKAQAVHGKPTVSGNVGSAFLSVTATGSEGPGNRLSWAAAAGAGWGRGRGPKQPSPSGGGESAAGESMESRRSLEDLANTDCYDRSRDSVDPLELLSSQAKAILDIYRATGLVQWFNTYSKGNLSTVCTWPGVLCGNGTLLSIFNEDQKTGLPSPKSFSNATIDDAEKPYHITAVSLQARTSKATTGFDFSAPNPVKLVWCLVYPLGVNGTALAIRNDTGMAFLNSTGSLDPINLSPLKYLRHFGVRTLNVTGALPVSLTRICSLKSLNFGNNYLSGKIPPSINNLVLLENLTLSVQRDPLGDPGRDPQRDPVQRGFVGPFPELSNLTNLVTLELSNNSFTGPIPDWVFTLPKLDALRARANNFSGPLPSTVGKAKSLVTLDLQENWLSGNIPVGFGQLPIFEALILSRNNFSGTIPADIGNATSISRLNLEGRAEVGGAFLTGELPDLSKLKDMESLKLGYQQLTGELPDWLFAFTGLRKLSVDHNRFYGKFTVPPKSILECNLTDGTNDEVANFAYNYFDSAAFGTFTPRPGANCSNIFKELWFKNILGNCFHNSSSLLRDPYLNKTDAAVLRNSSRPQADCKAFYDVLAAMQKRAGGSSSRTALVAGLSVVGCVMLLAAVACFMAWLWLRRHPRNNNSPVAGALREFTYEEMKTATDNFVHEIGKGGFGKVAWGRLPDGTEVAVKCRAQTSNQGRRELLNELETLSIAKHRHLVNVIGYCISGQNEILVYEYVSGGCLKDILKNAGTAPSRPLPPSPKSLTSTDGSAQSKAAVGGVAATPSMGPKAEQVTLLPWPVRLNICVGAAKGIAYLHYDAHSSKALIHRDIKTSNILLDRKGEAKVADFGLTKVAETEGGVMLGSIDEGEGGATISQSLNDGGDTSVLSVKSNASKGSGRSVITGASAHHGSSAEHRDALSEDTQVKGTFGYLDPAYAAGAPLSLASDVYSFGIMLWVLITGKEPAQWIDRQTPTKFMLREVIDPMLGVEEQTMESVLAVAELAESCVSYETRARPNMRVVLQRLEANQAQLGPQEGPAAQAVIPPQFTLPMQVQGSGRSFTGSTANPYPDSTDVSTSGAFDEQTATWSGFFNSGTFHLQKAHIKPR